LCPINFHGELFDHCQLYVAAYKDSFPGGEYLFPKLKVVGNITTPLQMDESDVNRSFNRAWLQFRDQSGDTTLPLKINSRMVRHRAVSAVHVTDDPKEMADAATAMSHSVHTAQKYYNAGDGMAAISRGNRRIRQLASSKSTPTSATAAAPSSSSSPSTSSQVSSPASSQSDEELTVQHSRASPESSSSSSSPCSTVRQQHEPTTSSTAIRTSHQSRQRQTVRPVYSPDHHFATSNWSLQRSEVDAIDIALEEFCEEVLQKWRRNSHLTVVSNQEILAIMMTKGTTYAQLVHELLKRPGAAKKVGDHIRTHLKTRGYKKTYK